MLNNERKSFTSFLKPPNLTNPPFNDNALSSKLMRVTVMNSLLSKGWYNAVPFGLLCTSSVPLGQCPCFRLSHTLSAGYSNDLVATYRSEEAQDRACVFNVFRQDNTNLHPVKGNRCELQTQENALTELNPALSLPFVMEQDLVKCLGDLEKGAN